MATGGGSSTVRTPISSPVPGSHQTCRDTRVVGRPPVPAEVDLVVVAVRGVEVPGRDEVVTDRRRPPRGDRAGPADQHHGRHRSETPRNIQVEALASVCPDVATASAPTRPTLPQRMPGAGDAPAESPTPWTPRREIG